MRLWDLADGPGKARLVARIDAGGGKVLSVAFDGDGRRLATGSADGGVRLFDLRPLLLLAHGPARAARLSEALQRLWRLRFDGADLVPEVWPRLATHGGGHPQPEVASDAAASTTAAQRGEPGPETLDIDPLLKPSASGSGRLDQLLDQSQRKGEKEGGKSGSAKW